MNYFQANNLSKSYAEKLLFEKISFGIDQGQKVALIARNGAGKTTLLNIMTGKDIADDGDCNFRNDIDVAYLPQNPVFDPNLTVEETLLHDDNQYAQTLRQYHEILQKTQKQPGGKYLEKLQQIITQMDALDAWNYETRFQQILGELKITNIHQPAGELSGGQSKRLALAKVLLEEADFIILDEPTNHLDLDMIEWLEGYLSKSKLTLLVVTHDRYFLDAVCNEILELEMGEMFRYKGNYAYFLEKKQERQNARQLETEKARNILRKEAEWMRRQPKARTTKSKARIESFHKLKETAQSQNETNVKPISVKAARLGKKILEVTDLQKSFDGQIIIQDFSYVFKRYEKVGIVGQNGTGKSTFLNIITGKLIPDEGKVTKGETINFGYYRQEGMKVDDNKKVMDVITDIAESIQLGNGKELSASQFLLHFNFSFQSQNDFVNKLSGGEKRRLYLMTVLMSNPNFLILDEPTNDLDIHTLNILEDFLGEFPGCLIVVSHDRYFLDKVVDHVFVFRGGGDIKDFPGNYTAYQQKKLQEKAEQKKENREKEKEESVEIVKEKTKTKLTFKEQKELESIEKEIALLEKDKRLILDNLNSGNLTPAELKEESEKFAAIEKLLEEKEERWMELSEFI